MFDLTPNYIQKAIDTDPILKKIIENNNIYIVQNIPNFSILDIGDIEMSNKCHKLLRIYIEKLLENLFKDKKNITIEDIDKFFTH